MTWTNCQGVDLISGDIDITVAMPTATGATLAVSPLRIAISSNDACAQAETGISLTSVPEVWINPHVPWMHRTI